MCPPFPTPPASSVTACWICVPEHALPRWRSVCWGCRRHWIQWRGAVQRPARTASCSAAFYTSWVQAPQPGELALGRSRMERGPRQGGLHQPGEGAGFPVACSGPAHVPAHGTPSFAPRMPGQERRAPQPCDCGVRFRPGRLPPPGQEGPCPSQQGPQLPASHTPSTRPLPPLLCVHGGQGLFPVLCAPSLLSQSPLRATSAQPCPGPQPPSAPGPAAPPAV